ncbi:hypothetical protein FRB95_014170 [Tulasnella sp. JGI-2019a]|nr:hypothetical protein FRB95_014170 [Tulasnella sp. JGI-2019a]
MSSSPTRCRTPFPHPAGDPERVEETLLRITEDEIQLKDNEEIIKKINELYQRAAWDEVHALVEDHAWRELEIIAHLPIPTHDVFGPFILHLLNSKHPTCLTYLSFNVSRSHPFPYFESDDGKYDVKALLKRALTRYASLTSLAMPARMVPQSRTILDRLTSLDLASLSSRDTRILPNILKVISKSSTLTHLSLSLMGTPGYIGNIPSSIRLVALSSVETLEVADWAGLERLFPRILDSSPEISHTAQ